MKLCLSKYGGVSLGQITCDRAFVTEMQIQEDRLQSMLHSEALIFSILHDNCALSNLEFLPLYLDIRWADMLKY